MTLGSLKPTTPKQWLKFALVPGLSVVLLGLLWQKPKSDSGAAETALAPVQPPAPTVAHASAQPQLPKATWPKARLEDVVAFNPFEREQLAESNEDASATADGKPVAGKTGGQSRSRLVTVQLQAIFVDAQGAAAVLDSQVIRVGDTLPSAGRVVEITPQGIKLEGT